MSDTSFTLHVRKDLGNGLSLVRMLQNGRVWQQSFSRISGAGREMSAGTYTGSLDAMLESYLKDGWEVVNLGNCATIDFNKL